CTFRNSTDNVDWNGSPIQGSIQPARCCTRHLTRPYKQNSGTKMLGTPARTMGTRRSQQEQPIPLMRGIEDRKAKRPLISMNGTGCACSPHTVNGRLDLPGSLKTHH